MADDWTDPAWLAEVRAWVDERLTSLGTTRSGEVEQPHVEPWSTVLRVPTGLGPVWFKATTASLRHEASTVALLARRAPDRVPPLLAADPDRGWMLMADAGERLREVVARERSLAHWHDALEGVAWVQLACTRDVEELLAAGVPDRRLPLLAEQYDALLAGLDVDPRYRSAAPLVERLAADLAAYGLPDSVQHDDLHDAQVFLRPGGDGPALLMDWGDACVTHPFLVLAVPLRGVIAWGLDDEEDAVDTAPYRESYLGPWAAARPDLGPDALRDAADLATRLGWACRAVNGHVPGDLRSTELRLRMFLDGRVTEDP
ncbi:hypothetical protein QWY28_12580 [Nocardioides sp. SOB77]|uniref:Aminoglycoside phosphotransferase family protein n=1 Tax=Nocardioides oceani TaxID=3058369 RepID=A0ABT8FGQ6_9ACTN|nr:hypothetical protein [Nocardioides oceani]MDN4173789.1 hypothetical protein [Nocardioides oceani]